MDRYVQDWAVEPLRQRADTRQRKERELERQFQRSFNEARKEWRR